MQNPKCKILYEDNDLLVIDKPAGINAEDIPKRIHRLDKNTSGILLVAKNDKILKFFQRQFKERKVEKKYIALVVGNIKNEQGIIETLIGRSPKNGKKQKVFLPGEPDAEGKRKAITEYRVLQRLEKYSLLEVVPKTGRKHQIRCHFAYLQNPIAGDKLYGFKNQPCPEGLNRHFLHASHIRIKLPSGEIKEFKSELPEELKKMVIKLNN